MRFALLSLLLCIPVAAQMPKIEGDYSGVVGPLHLKLHLKAGAGGAVDGTLDSVDQGATGLPCANFNLEHTTLSFEVPSVGGKWHGTVSDDGATLTGSWWQGAEIPLVFHRDASFDAAEKPSRVDGVWLGTLGGKLRVQVHVKSDRAGKEYCSMDSLDQGASDLPCENVQLESNHFSFAVPVVQGHWSGTLNDDGNQLTGTWSQLGHDLPLQLNRQTTALAPEKPKPPKFDDAIPPVSPAELKAVLDKDVAAALQNGS
jgi:serine-type D-Ala-D-Ala carboxypeptidase/endopeptidase